MRGIELNVYRMLEGMENILLPISYTIDNDRFSNQLLNRFLMSVKIIKIKNLLEHGPFIID